MALVSVRSDVKAPCLSKTFTSFAAAQVLHEATGSTATGAAPAGINHLPSSVFVVAAAADHLIFKDTLGVTNDITFSAAFTGTVPFTIASLETGTTADSVTVSWNPKP